MLFLCNNTFDTQVEMIMNIQLYVPKLSSDKPKHCPFQFPPYRSGTLSLHEHCRITSLMLFQGTQNIHIMCEGFSLRKIIIQVSDAFVFPDKEKQP